MREIERVNATPLYRQLKNIIKKEIRCGMLKPGDKLPSEAQMQKKYEMSRVTIRNAMAELESEGYIYSVNLWAYTQIAEFQYFLYWIMYGLLVLFGIIKLFSVKSKRDKYNQLMTGISMVLGIILVMFLALAREAYAVIVAFLLLVMAYWKHRENIKRLLTGTERKTYLFKKNKVE